MNTQQTPWQWQRESYDSDSSILVSSGSFDESWYQGRGVFGGLSAAIILQGMIELEPLRSPRTFTLHCVAPILAGDAKLFVKCERRGAKVSHLSARLLDTNQRVLAFASASFGEARSFSKHIAALAAPDAPLPNQVEEVPKDLEIMPAFCRYFSYRFCLDHLPYTQAKEATMGGWCQLRQNLPISYPYLACILDAWAPAVFPTLTAPIRAASVDFTYHFLCNREELLNLELPFLYRGEVLSLSDGYAEERDYLWDRKGKAIATARQLYAYS
ncbi:MAG: hypothetical protein CMH49_09125 [Myxococcales bacterium]|nr:hypothetical protein [Myxococcales bacterium]